MKKIKITNQTINDIIFDYTEKLMSSNNLHIKYNVPKKRVLEILH